VYVRRKEPEEREGATVEPPASSNAPPS
jgi:hypothetical protein